MQGFVILQGIKELTSLSSIMLQELCQKFYSISPYGPPNCFARQELSSPHDRGGN